MATTSNKPNINLALNNITIDYNTQSNTINISINLFENNKSLLTKVYKIIDNKIQYNFKIKNIENKNENDEEIINTLIRQYIGIYKENTQINTLINKVISELNNKQVQQNNRTKKKKSQIIKLLKQKLTQKKLKESSNVNLLNKKIRKLEEILEDLLNYIFNEHVYKVLFGKKIYYIKQITNMKKKNFYRDDNNDLYNFTIITKKLMDVLETRYIHPLQISKYDKPIKFLTHISGYLYQLKNTLHNHFPTTNVMFGCGGDSDDIEKLVLMYKDCRTYNNPIELTPFYLEDNINYIIHFHNNKTKDNNILNTILKPSSKSTHTSNEETSSVASQPALESSSTSTPTSNGEISLTTSLPTPNEEIPTNQINRASDNILTQYASAIISNAEAIIGSVSIAS